MAGNGHGTVIVPWYATGFRAEGFEQALNDVAAVALRYNASSYAVYRQRDDRYRFQQLASFAEHVDWERYWEGPEMTDFRVLRSSWFQVPVLYGWWDLTTSGNVLEESYWTPPAPPAPPASSSPEPAPAGNGHGDGSRVTEV